MSQDTPDRKMSKPTFAKVVASSYNPVPAKSTPNPSQQSTTNPTHDNQISSPLNGLKETAPNEHIEKTEKHIADDTSSDQSTNNIKTPPDSIRIEDAYPKQNGNDDGSTQLSSDGSAKLPSFDTKSVASVATFAMDEKESLRPDDSASIRAAAVEDDDLVSAPGSVITGSRVGSDIGAKAFREQLHEIANINPLRVNDTSSNHFHGPTAINSARTPQSQPSDQLPLMSISTPNMQHTVHSPLSPPDEKLLEALQSPRDRVFVLKLEQDLIDFIGQSKEATLALPKCNGFYRMLAHKLADYYRLDHTVEHTQTGAAVIITRTSFCRLAPPLSGLPNPSASNTPPLVIQARKIMRRPDDPKTSETSTAANSEGPSAAPSEVGVESGLQDPSPSSGSDTKPKTALTREEREAKYAEARERIFGKNEGIPDGNDAAEIPEENFESRASSTTGKKKTVNKQRNLSNDDFEPRSQFYGPSPAPNGYPNDQFYYQNYGTVQPGSPYPMPPNTAPPMNYVAGYPGMVPGDGQSQFGWQAPPMQMHHTGVTMPSYPQGPNGVYDMSAHFNAGMQSFQNAGPTGPMQGKMPSPVASAYPQAPSTNQWPQQPFDPNFQYVRPGYPQPNMNDRQMAVPTMMPPPNQYSYGQYHPMPGPMPAKNYVQGNAGRPQFNPQIRSFVPAVPQQAPMAMPAGVPPYGSHPSMPVHVPPPMNRPIPVQNHQDNRSNFGSPRPVSTTTPIPHNSAPSAVTNQEPSTAATSSSSPPSTIPGGKPVSEITAKWGTPAHLPRKPPPPESMEPHKYMEINKGLHQQYPGLPRINANGFGNNGFNGNANNRFGS